MYRKLNTSRVSCVAVSETQLLFLLCQQIIVNMSSFTLSKY